MTISTAPRRGRAPGSTLRKRDPIFTTDDDGNSIVRVPLARDAGHATVDRADFDRLMDAGISTCWWLVRTGDGPNRHPVVRTWVGGKDVGVARLILGADPHARITFASEDRTDLRRSNISAKKVNARGEGDARTGVMREREAWVSVARTPAGKTKAQERAERRAAEQAAYAAFQAAQAERVARWQAWIETQVAAGRDRQQATEEAMAQAREERRAYCAQHGLDPQTGRFPREPKAGKDVNRIGAPVPPQPQHASFDPATLPY